MTNTAPLKIHPFESRGLGKAPYVYVGSYESKYQACPGAPMLPGTSCDYCGTGIMYVCQLRSSDGNGFKVGCDCVLRVLEECAGTDDEREMRRLYDKAREPLRKMERDRRAARALAQASAAAELLADDANRARLASLPHPRFDESGHSLLTWAEWMLRNAGGAGKMRVAKVLRAALAAPVAS